MELSSSPFVASTPKSLDLWFSLDFLLTTGVPKEIPSEGETVPLSKEPGKNPNSQIPQPRATFWSWGSSPRILLPFLNWASTCMGFPGGASGKEPSHQRRRHQTRGFDLRVGKIPWRRAWQPSPVFLPGESHGERRLAGYSPWGHKESDMIEAT